MVIACLGWGSLIWDSGDLPIKGTWYTDGPFLPVEFARQSADNRITLVIVRWPTVPVMRSLWAILNVETIEDAVETLRKRELIPAKNVSKHIGRWRKDEQLSDDPIAETIHDWARQLELDGVVWTDLPPKFENQNGRVPSVEEVIRYLDFLQGDERKLAKQYVQMAPLQIDTTYRREIETRLGWKSIAEE